ncbi:unnamed protein product, partial [Rotaria sp. Silwood1]
LSEYLNERQV